MASSVPPGSRRHYSYSVRGGSTQRGWSGHEVREIGLERIAGQVFIGEGPAKPRRKIAGYFEADRARAWHSGRSAQLSLATTASPMADVLSGFSALGSRSFVRAPAASAASTARSMEVASASS